MLETTENLQPRRDLSTAMPIWYPLMPDPEHELMPEEDRDAWLEQLGPAYQAVFEQLPYYLQQHVYHNGAGDVAKAEDMIDWLADNAPPTPPPPPPPRYVPQLGLQPIQPQFEVMPRPAPRLGFGGGMGVHQDAPPRRLALQPTFGLDLASTPPRLGFGGSMGVHQAAPPRKPRQPAKPPPVKQPKRKDALAPSPGMFVNSALDEVPKHVFGYRSERKNNFIGDQLGIAKGERAVFPQNVNHFDIKNSKRLWKLHAAYPLGTWFMDIMQISKAIKYLILVDACSRYVIAEIINEIEPDTNVVVPGAKGFTSPQAFMDAFARMMDKNPELMTAYPDGSPRVKTIQSDSDSAWASDKVQKWLFNGFGERKVWRPVPRVKQQEYPSWMELENAKVKTEPNHTSLAILDRAVRTIRDVAFNLRIDQITPNQMERILMEVNSAPNDSFRKILGFDVSPWMVLQSWWLQKEIVRRFTTWNELVYASPGFMLPVGTLVQVYNDNHGMAKRRELVKPHVYRVERFNGVFFGVRNIDQPHDYRKVQRWKLKPYRKRADAKIA
jgi:hypothetical protein